MKKNGSKKNKKQSKHLKVITEHKRYNKAVEKLLDKKNDNWLHTNNPLLIGGSRRRIYILIINQK